MVVIISTQLPVAKKLSNHSYSEAGIFVHYSKRPLIKP